MEVGRQDELVLVQPGHDGFGLWLADHMVALKVVREVTVQV